MLLVSFCLKISRDQIQDLTPATFYALKKKIFKFLLNVFILLGGTHMYQSMFVKVRGQLSGVAAILLVYGYWGLNSGYQACLQMPLPTELSHWI